MKEISCTVSDYQLIDANRLC